MKNKLICALLVLAITISALCIIPIQADAANPNTIIMRLNSTSAFLNRSKIAVDPSNPDVSPFTLNSKTMVPVRFVQQLGADVKYTSTSEPVTVTYGEIALSLSFGKSEMHKVVAGEHAGIIDLPTPPTLVEGKTCVPIREIAEGLGFSVNYNSGSSVIVVSTSALSTSKLDTEMKYGTNNLPSFVEGVKSITAKTPTRSISVGGSVQLSTADITFNPARVGCQLLLYSTSDPGVATVTSKGKIIGVADGRANITVSSHNGRTAVIEVTVGTGQRTDYPQVHPIVYDEFLLGGSQDGKWIAAKDVMPLVEDGANYKLYNEKGYLYDRTGKNAQYSDPYVGDEDAFGVWVDINNAPSQPFLALSAGWNAMPRIPAFLDVSNDIYKNHIKDILAADGIKNVPIRIRQLIKVDLDGDGTDEVLICAENVTPDSADSYFMPSYSGTVPGYSMIVVRKIVDGTVKSFILYKTTFAKGDFVFSHRISQIADLNGDGILDIIANEFYYEGTYYSVHDGSGDLTAKVIGNGWGV